MHCKRKSGTERAWFSTREDAVRFAEHPANHPVYLGDVAHLCDKCGYWHLSNPSWLQPLLCECCSEEIPANTYYLIRDGKRVHETCAMVN